MSTLSSQSYKGTRDYYPEDMRVRNYIFSVWHTVAKRYGYDEYATPLLEPLEIYTAKSGQELASEQTYTFVDRGDRQVAIRPEMTPSVSRLVAARRQELAYPARLYSIANFMRYERPQRGREREFWQCNMDIFGAESAAADAEIIQMGVGVLREFGAKDTDYVVKLNNRKLVDVIMSEYLQLDPVQSQLMIKLFDRKNKLASEAFRDQAIEIFGQEAAQTGLKRIAELLVAKKASDMPKAIAEAEAMKDVNDVLKHLKTVGITHVTFDPTLMRGLDYYTGTVFEFFDTHPENNRAMYGGGRYDGLVGLFGAEPVSAVGIAPGLTPTELFLQSHGLLPQLATETDVYVVVLGEDAQKGATKLAERLRSEKVNVELDITGRKLDKQIKTAVKKGVPYMLFVGESELKNEVYSLKNTASSDEQSLSFERVVTTIKDKRHKRKKPVHDELDDLI